MLEQCLEMCVTQLFDSEIQKVCCGTQLRSKESSYNYPYYYSLPPGPRPLPVKCRLFSVFSQYADQLLMDFQV